MKITDVRFTRISIPHKEPIKSSYGLTYGSNRWIVEVVTDEGLSGLGDTPWTPYFDAALATEIKERILGQSPLEIEVILQRLQRGIIKNYARIGAQAVSGVESACWDLLGQVAGQPVYRLLGGKVRDSFELCPVVFMADRPEERAQAAQRLVDYGYKSLKIKAGVDFASDLRSIKLIRETVGPDIPLRVDVNGNWDITQAKEAMPVLEECRLQYLEQPLPAHAWNALAELRRYGRVPIALNETVYLPEEIFLIAERNMADLVLVDPCAAGGLIPAKKIIHVCECAGIGVAVHTGGETAIARAAKVHLVVSSPSLRFAVDHIHPGLADDIVREVEASEGASLTVKDTPGFGVTLDVTKLDKYSQAGIYSRKTA